MGKYDNVTMKEYMKKKKEILNDLSNGLCYETNCIECPFFVKNLRCDKIEMLNPDKALEIVMEYEPKIDWSKAEVDTKVLTRNSEYEEWKRGYFSAYNDGKIYVFINGKTSFTTNISEEVKYAKLYKGDE